MVKIMSKEAIEREGWEALFFAEQGVLELETENNTVGGVDVRFSEVKMDEDDVPEIDLSLLDTPVEEWIPREIDMVVNSRKNWWEFAKGKK